MSYYFSKIVKMDFDLAIQRTIEVLGNNGFGVLTEIDVAATMKKKLDVDFKKYRILGACNPPFAYKALIAEDKIGTMLPCNVIVQELEEGSIEIAAIDPIASMKSVENDALGSIAIEIQGLLKKVVSEI